MAGMLSAVALFVVPVLAAANDTEVIVGSKDNLFSQNKQNEPAPRPAPNTDYPAAFGNSSIYGCAYADPTP